MKFKIITLFISFFLIAIAGYAQETLNVNLFVDAEKSIYLEDKKITLNNVSTKVKELVYNQPALKYSNVVYNIYGDKKLKHGFIMLLNQKMLAGYNSEKIKTKKFLLEYSEINIDGENWQKKVKSLDLPVIEN